MGARKPTAGFASRTEAVYALQAKGFSDRAIAVRLGIAVSTVSALAHSGARPKRKPVPEDATGRTIVFPVDILDRLMPHATRRGMHVNSLVRTIVEQVVDDRLVDAVLDDAAREPA